MPDIEYELRQVASALVANPPAPPPLPSSLTPDRRPARTLSVALVAAAAVVLVAATVSTASQRGTRRVDVVRGAQSPGRAAFRCAADAPLRVTPAGATSGPFYTEAPGTLSAEPGQRVMHWTGADGAVEIRWPAAKQALYGDGTTGAHPLPVAQVASPTKVEFDVAPQGDIATSPAQFAPDVRVEPEASVAPADAPCDTLVLLVTLGAGQWSTGLRATRPSDDLGLPFETLDVQPVIAERRAVEAAPDEVVACEGAGVPGGPPRDRVGGPDPNVRGTQPSDVLREYIERTQGATRSGYVEMTTPDGNFTYAVDASGRGWTTILSVARDGTEWHLARWQASGC